MNLSELALNNSRVTILAVLGIVGMGLVTFLSYPSAEDPTITIRNVTVTAYHAGMTAKRVEELITDPIEIALREVAEIDEITSTSKTGESRIDVTIHDRVGDLEPVFQDVRNKMDDVRPKLPTDTVGPLSTTRWA